MAIQRLGCGRDIRGIAVCFQVVAIDFSVLVSFQTYTVVRAAFYSISREHSFLGSKVGIVESGKVKQEWSYILTPNVPSWLAQEERFIPLNSERPFLLFSCVIYIYIYIYPAHGQDKRCSDQPLCWVFYIYIYISHSRPGQALFRSAIMLAMVSQ